MVHGDTRRGYGEQRAHSFMLGGLNWPELLLVGREGFALSKWDVHSGWIGLLQWLAIDGRGRCAGSSIGPDGGAAIRVTAVMAGSCASHPRADGDSRSRRR